MKKTKSVSNHLTRSLHTLHLYGPNVDKFMIQKPFFTLTESDEKMIYITSNPSSSFKSINIDLMTLEPEEMSKLDAHTDKQLRIIIDGDSVLASAGFDTLCEVEEYINKLSENHQVNCLCTYDLAKLDSDKTRQLAEYHKRLLLTTTEITVLSGEPIDTSELSNSSIDKMVKDHLDAIVLALLQRKPMCGYDILQVIHREFNVFLGPGKIYPLLHTLKKSGLLKLEQSGKMKIYLPADEEAKKKIQDILDERVRGSRLLSNYLQQVTT